MSPAPPAALTLVRPRPPCASLRSGGGQTWRWVRGFWLTGWLVTGRAEHEDKPPVPSALPPGVGRSRGFLNMGVLRQGASRFAMSFTRAPDANLDAKILAKKPTKLGGQRRAKRGSGGLVPHSAKPTQRAKHQPRTQRQVCPPPETAGRDTGGPRTNESEGRGGCGGRVIPSAKPPLHAKRQPLDTACWRPEGEAGIGASISTRD